MSTRRTGLALYLYLYLHLHYSSILRISPSFRSSIFVFLFYGKKLFQQYIVDAFLKVEPTRLRFLAQNQREISVENYRGLIDLCKRIAQQNLAATTCGLHIILPSSFTHGLHHMHQLYQNRWYDWSQSFWSPIIGNKPLLPDPGKSSSWTKVFW